MEFQLTDDYPSLFLNDTPMLDVRAPVEFTQGAFPQAQNMPLMNDEERHEVGICYNKQGQDAAIDLGHEYVSGDIKQARMNAWLRFVDQHPDGVLYCFRGGMRSKIAQQWIHKATGIDYPRVQGGYKAMRRYLIDQLEDAARTIQPVILGGRTGTGKTCLLQHIKHMIDLENIYHHRGSVFGIHATPQPGQINAENTLSIHLLKFRHQGILKLVMEDESANIGSRRIPEKLYARMQNSPIILLEVDDDQRVTITFDEYITSALSEYQKIYGEDKGFQQWSGYLLYAIDKIQKRLGGNRHKMLSQLMQHAIERHHVHGDTDPHRDWIHTLLIDYYDPMYDYQLGKKQDRIIFQGSPQEILDYLHEQQHIALAA